MSIEDVANLLTHSSYLIANNVVYLVIADKSYPRKLAFSYLDELSKEFEMSYGAKVENVRKPYAFVGFGMSISIGVCDLMELTFYQTHSWAKPHDCTRTHEPRAQVPTWTS